MKKEKKKSHIIIKIFCLLVILIVLIFLYGRYINPYSFKVNEIAIINEELPSDYNGFKIVQLSDIHYGRTTNEETLKKIVNKINELNPDIVIFTGDLFDNTTINESEEALLIKYLGKIEAKLFKFAVIGDYDEEYLNIYTNILNESDFTLLDNSNYLVYYNSTTPLDFIGITNLTDISELFQNDYFKITLVHKPDYVTDLLESNIVFAGHSLGGQFKVPFIGGIKKIDGASTYIDSYYQIDNTSLYISNGIGTQDISMRINNSPSITLYRLYNY